MNFKTLGTQIISNFDAPIRYAFGYGSGVIKQGAKNKKGMIDLIFGVTHPAHCILF